MNEWRAYQLEDCMSAIIDYRGKTPQKTTAGVPLITAKIVKSGRIETPEEFIAEEDFDVWMRRGMPESGDVLMTTEAPLGEIAQLGAERVALAQRIIALRGKPGLLDNTFLKFLMQSLDVQNQLHARASGTTVLGIKQSELRKLSLTLPPFDEQRAIAHVLGSLDDKVELNRKYSEILQTMAGTIFRAWFVDFEPIQAKIAGRWSVNQSLPGLPAYLYDLFPASMVNSEIREIPAGWSLGPLSRIASVIMGQSPDGSSYNTEGAGSPLINGPVEFGEYFPVKTKWTTSPTKLSEARDLILCVRGSTTGRHVLADGVYCLGRGVCAIRPSANARSFTYHAVKHGLSRLLSKTTGSVFPNLSGPDINQFDILMPPKPLIEAFGDITRDWVERIELLIRESETLVTLRDGLLPKLISGEIRVKDSERLVGSIV
jgi:type I restriction enzyme, S subunit